MSQLKALSFVGDSNIKRNMVASTTSGRPLLVEAQVLLCGRLSLLSATLDKVRPESDACIIACVSNFVTGAIGNSPEASVDSRVQSILDSFFEKIVAFCHQRPTTFVFVCSPMYRTKPLWYRDGLPRILIKFSALYEKTPDRPHNLLRLPCFPRVDLETDGVHLTPFSGLEYILHLLNSAQSVRASLELPPEGQLHEAVSSVRAVEDRVHWLEQDHSYLRKSFELQSAYNAEAIDHQENVRNEVFFMLQGLPRLPRLDPKAWHERALSDVNQLITQLGFEAAADYVQNTTGRNKDARVLYKVHVKTPELSKSIRNKFSSFFSGGQDTRPDFLKNISIRNCVTQATLGRIAILQLLGRRYRDSNVGARFQVISYEPRPLLKLIPAPGSSDKRVLTFNFMEAITKLPTNFTQDETKELLKRISPRLHGSLRSLFVVINDDMLSRPAHNSVRSKNSSRSGGGQLPRRPSHDPTSPGSESCSSSSGFKTPDDSGSRKRGRAGTSSGPASKK